MTACHIAFHDPLDADVLREEVQLASAHQLAAHARQESLPLFRIGGEQQATDDGIQHGISQELQALIVR